jgi:hypothetical protein
MLNIEKFTEIVRAANSINMLDNNTFAFVNISGHVNQLEIYVDEFPQVSSRRIYHYSFYYYGYLAHDEDDEIYDDIIAELTKIWKRLAIKIDKLAEIKKLQEDLETLG